MKRSFLLAAGALALAFGAGAAQAQNYGRIITFGDSLSDAGNFFAGTGQPPPPYNQRFTNELVWSEYLFGPRTLITSATPATINAGNINAAFSFARSDLAPNLSAPGTPGTPAQIGAFFGLGGQIRPTDLVTIWAGANNIFQGIPGAAATPATAAATMAGIATAAAADVGNQIRFLAGNGARTVLAFNLPDIGLSPSFLGSPAQALASFSASTFNQALFAQALNGGGANVILIPVDQIFSAILGNPAGFGFANVTQQCLTTPACVGNPAARNSFLFWDGVHPTAAGHQLIAASVREYLLAPARAAAVSGALGNTAFGNRRSTSIEALGQLSALPTQPEAWRWFVYATGEAGRNGSAAQGALLSATPQAGFGSRAEFSQAGLRFGGLRGLGGGWTVGLMASVLRGEIDGKAVQFKADNMQFGLDLLARWRSQTGTFVNLGLGVSLDSITGYEYRTIGPLVNRGSTRALSWSASAEVGHDFAFGQFVVTPQGRLSYISSRLEAFNEAGVVAPVGYGARNVGAFGAAAELKLAYNFTATSSAYVLAGYETVFGNDNGNTTGVLIGNTAQPFSWRVEAPRAPGFVAGAGLALNFGAVTGRVAYRGTFGEKNSQRHSVSIGIDGRF